MNIDKLLEKIKRERKDCMYYHGYGVPDMEKCPGCQQQIKYFWEKIMANPAKVYPFETSMFNKKK